MTITDFGWAAIRQSVVAIALVSCLVFGYQNGWESSPDFRTVIVTLVSLLGVDTANVLLGRRLK